MRWFSKKIAFEEPSSYLYARVANPKRTAVVNQESEPASASENSNNCWKSVRCSEHALERFELTRLLLCVINTFAISHRLQTLFWCSNMISSTNLNSFAWIIILMKFNHDRLCVERPRMNHRQWRKWICRLSILRQLENWKSIKHIKTTRPTDTATCELSWSERTKLDLPESLLMFP